MMPQIMKAISCTVVVDVFISENLHFSAIHNAAKSCNNFEDKIENKNKL